MRIAIIGGGLSGTVMAMKLFDNMPGDSKIFLFERHDSQLNRGIAYSCSLEFQPLNVRARDMNISAEEGKLFYDWLKINWQKYLPCFPEKEDFISRKVFGHYVQEIFAREIELFRSTQRHFEIVNAEVTGVEPVKKGVKIHFDGHAVVVDKVILAIGNFPPGDIKLKNGHLSASKLLQANPWQTSWLNSVKPEDIVLFIGSGLTTVDLTVNLLRNKQHHGKIIILSRRGLLPATHEKYTPVSIERLPNLLNVSALDVLKIVRQRVETYGSTNWRNVIDDLRLQVPALWSNMSISERKSFLRHLRPFWEVHRHRVSGESMRILRNAIDAGKVVLYAGRLIDVQEHGENGRARALIRNMGEINISFNRIINATGPEADCRKWDQSLVNTMLQNGSLREDILGLGIDVNLSVQVMNSDGQPNSSVYAIGALRKGSMWECTALKEILAQASQIADSIEIPDVIDALKV